MAKWKDIGWTAVGLGALAFSGVLLERQLRTISLDQVTASLQAIPFSHWFSAVAASIAAYTALAWYDRIALRHLGRSVAGWFVALCAFTTYALSHNIGATVFSGALVRYRAYRSRGLTPYEIGLVIVFCAFTFTLGTITLLGAVLLVDPTVLGRLLPSPHWVSQATGAVLLSLVGLYVWGSWRHFPAKTWGKIHLEYPRLGIAVRQLLAGPIELLCAAAIISVALPEVGHPGYFTVLGVFLLSFSLALISHAPGGLGVLEVTFLSAFPELPTVDVLAALIVFRILYLLIPFALSLLVVLAFETHQWRQNRSTHLKN